MNHIDKAIADIDRRIADLSMYTGISDYRSGQVLGLTEAKTILLSLLEPKSEN